MSSPKRLARIAGVLYLFVGIFGGFSEGFVDSKMYVAGNATATAANVVKLRYFVGMTIPEIAEAIGISPAARIGTGSLPGPG